MVAKVKQFKPLKAVSKKLGFGDIKYPMITSLKIDGVYGLNLLSKFLGRSLKPMKNEWLTDKFSVEELQGICGEVCYADLDKDDLRLNRQDLCRATTSKVNTIKGGEFEMVWVLFDYIKDGSEEYCYGRPFVDRMYDLIVKLEDDAEVVDYGVHALTKEFMYHRFLWRGITIIVPLALSVATKEEMERLYDHAIELGFEGTVGRNADGVYKFGRATENSQEIVRFKPEGTSEIIVMEFEPAFENNNEATINELGHTTRSSHKENKVMLPMVGAMVGLDVNTGLMTRVGAGRMSHAEREEVWNNQEKYLHKLSNYLFMDTGIKDAPRHPRHAMWRPVTDLDFSDEIVAKLKELGITVK